MFQFSLDFRRSKPRFNLNYMKFCDPIGDENVWSSLFSIGNITIEVTNETIISHKVRYDIKYIIVAARLDTTSLFSEHIKGAINPITSIVTLLNTAHLLKKLLPSYEDYGKINVISLVLTEQSSKGKVF